MADIVGLNTNKLTFFDVRSYSYDEIPELVSVFSKGTAISVKAPKERFKFARAIVFQNEYFFDLLHEDMYYRPTFLFSQSYICSYEEMAKRVKCPEYLEPTFYAYTGLYDIEDKKFYPFIFAAVGYDPDLDDGIIYASRSIVDETFPIFKDDESGEKIQEFLNNYKAVQDNEFTTQSLLTFRDDEREVKEFKQRNAGRYIFLISGVPENDLKFCIYIENETKKWWDCTI